MIVSISGTEGSGKSTIGKLLAKRINFSYMTVGALQRQLAAEHDMTISEFTVYENEHPEIDRELDKRTASYQDSTENIIFEARLAFHFIPKSIKIFFTVDEDEAARRIYEDKERSSEDQSSKDQVKQTTRRRHHNDVEKYKKLYNVDIDNKENYDLIVDTTTKSPEEVVDLITTYLKEHGHL
ncbi:MAG: cytidylate kinase family protein [Candidatus Woesearchaeota archaeon]|nr:MAG: cytidylate kinase family protein [Candidatus Woesearchaeota archaeon]